MGEASPRTPVRILMELGQQQKFQINYQFADPPPRPCFNKSEGSDIVNEEIKDGDVNMEAAGEEMKKESIENGSNSEDKSNGLKKDGEGEETLESEKEKENASSEDSILTS